MRYVDQTAAAVNTEIFPDTDFDSLFAQGYCLQVTYRPEGFDESDPSVTKLIFDLSDLSDRFIEKYPVAPVIAVPRPARPQLRPTGQPLCLHIFRNRAVALAYAEDGIAVFACGQDKKPKPGVMWRNQSTTDPVTIRAWFKRWPDAITGIDLAKCNKVVVDSDRHNADQDGVAALAALEADPSHEPFEAHPISNTRSGGHHHIFENLADDPLGNGRGALPLGIDIRGHGGFIIAPGSVTPEGSWVADPDTPDFLESHKAGTTPTVPPWLVELIRAKPDHTEKAAPGSEGPRQEHKSEAGPRERAFAQKALDGWYDELAALTDDRNNRLNIGSHRLHRMVARGWLSETEVTSRLERACQVNGEWARKGAAQCQATIASGRKSGLADPHPDLKDNDTDMPEPLRLITVKGITCTPDGEVVEFRPKTKPAAPPTDIESLTDCPGLIGEIVDWIEATARRPNRVFALGAAIAVIGTLIGRRVAGPTDSGTHLYVLGLGRTGAGKQTPMDRATDLLYAAGASHIVGPGEFTSGPAVSYHLEQNPLSLCCQDEFGSFIARINRHNASSWETQVSKLYRELWGLSFRPHNGMQWANRDRKVVHAPAMSLLAFSTPEQFFDALKGGDLTNGFVNRFLVLPGKKERKRMPKLKPIVPENITNALVQLYPWRGVNSYDVSDTNRNHIPIAEMHDWASASAEKRFEAFESALEDRMEATPRLEYFLERTAEMSVRLATIRAAGRNIGNYDFKVDLSDIEWGIALASFAGEQLIAEAGDLMEETPHSRALQKVTNIIREHQPIPHSVLLKKSKLKGKELEDIIKDLRQREDIEVMEEPLPNGGLPRRAYRLMREK
jgi:hypothetical protein